MLGRLRALALVGTVLLVGAFLGSAASQWWGTSPVPGPGVSQAPSSHGRVRVEVLNAGGISGRAAEATAALRDAGFDVVLFGNAPAFDSESLSSAVSRTRISTWTFP